MWETLPPAVTADDGLGCREAETDAPGGAVARSVDPVKRAEDPSQGIRWDSGPSIPHGNRHEAFPAAELDLRWRGVFHGVVDQVGERPLQAEWPAAIDCMGRPEVTDFNPLIGVIVGDGLQYAREIEARRRFLVCITTEERQSPVDHRLHLVDIPEQFRLLYLVVDQLATQTHARQRRTQIVRDGRQHHRALRHEFLDLRLHGIESADHFAEFPGPALGERRGLRIDTKAAYRAGELLDGPNESAWGHGAHARNRHRHECQPDRPALQLTQ